ncbi:MAG: nucleotide exchange factor GrpE [Marmoricola sp.]
MTSPDDRTPDEGPEPGGEPQETAAPQPGSQPGSQSGSQPDAGTHLRPGGDPEIHPDESGSFGDDADQAPLEGHDLSASDELILAQTALAERTLDLQRLQAEFLNYKRRVERDRELVQQNAVYSVLSGMLPVLDDIDRAREHGELEGGFKAVADSLERTVTTLGLTKFGAKGDEFDPRVHEALMHGLSPDVTTTTVDVVAHAGYRIGDRVLRAAKVTVLDPES